MQSCQILHTDQGRELWKSNTFHQAAQLAGYLLEPIAANTPFQNSIAE